MEEIKEACAIKIGDYVRTKKGIIAKIQAYQELKIYNDGDEEAIFKNYETDRGTIADVDIKNHSKNIFDLIESEDYVNGEPVEQVTEFEITTTTEYLTNPKDIKSIVTREQFEKAEYKLDN